MPAPTSAQQELRRTSGMATSPQVSAFWRLEIGRVGQPGRTRRRPVGNGPGPRRVVHNEPVGRHTGELAHDAPRVPRRRVLVLSLLVALTLVAWGALVFAAIAFGRDARSGQATAWTFLVVATLGAIACLLVTMILGGRLVSLVRTREVASPRPIGGRRAAR